MQKRICDLDKGTVFVTLATLKRGMMLSAPKLNHEASEFKCRINGRERMVRGGLRVEIDGDRP